jgi:hypothetical protein
MYVYLYGSFIHPTKFSMSLGVMKPVAASNIFVIVLCLFEYRLSFYRITGLDKQARLSRDKLV